MCGWKRGFRFGMHDGLDHLSETEDGGGAASLVQPSGGE